MADLRTFITESAEDGDFDGPVDAAEIDALETVLGLTLPPTYRAFLAELGVGDVAGHEFFGIIRGKTIDEDSGIPSVGVTLGEWRSRSVPSGLVIVGETGMGEWYVLDTATVDASGECPVRIYSPGARGFVPGHDHADFGEFALTLLRG